MISKTATSRIGTSKVRSLVAIELPPHANPEFHRSATGRRAAVGSWWDRLARAALAALVVGCIVLAAQSPAWARKTADNGKSIPQADSESNVTAYLIVVVGIMVGLTAICRKNYRTADPPRRSEA